MIVHVISSVADSQCSLVVGWGCVNVMQSRSISTSLGPHICLLHGLEGIHCTVGGRDRATRLAHSSALFSSFRRLSSFGLASFCSRLLEGGIWMSTSWTKPKNGSIEVVSILLDFNSQRLSFPVIAGAIFYVLVKAAIAFPSYLPYSGPALLLIFLIVIPVLGFFVSGKVRDEKTRFKYYKRFYVPSVTGLGLALANIALDFLIGVGTLVVEFLQAT